MAKAKAVKPAPKKAVKKTETKAAKTRASKNDSARDYGYMLFMQRVSQNEIAERCNVSVQTVSDWKKKDNWEAKRASKSISMDTLIQKALERINEMLEKEGFNADGFAKAVAQLKTLKVRNTVDDEVNCFMDFQNYLLERRTNDNIPQEFIKALTRYQDNYIQYRLGNV